METRAHHILIGLFTVIVAGAAVVALLWLGKVDSNKHFDIYDIVFEEAVSGLNKGSTVEFNGIKVGEVINLRLDPNDPRRALARVRIDSMAPIRVDTRARLVMVGVTGISKIRLRSGKSLQSAALPPAAEGEVPVIVADPSPLSKLLNDSDDVALNVGEILAQTRKLFSAENVESINHSLRNLEQTSGTIAAQREEMAQALRQANVALAETTRLMSGANRLLDEQGRQTLESAQRSMAAFERSMQTIDRLVAENRGSLDGGARSLAELGPAIAELRGVLASLRQVTQRLEENPSGFMLGREPTREFTP